MIYSVVTMRNVTSTLNQELASQNAKENIMEKLRIVQVSGNSNYASYAGDSCADEILRDCGFVSRHPERYSPLYIGCVPEEGMEFFVYYEEPAGDSGGIFKLIRMAGDEEIVVDKGTACESHFHDGLKTKTFYGKGNRLRSWSFHCSPESIK